MMNKYLKFSDKQKGH